MSSVRKLVKVLLAVSLILLGGEAWSQWVLPPDYSRDNNAQNPRDMRGGKNPGMSLLYYENFEKDKSSGVVTEWGVVPAGWRQESVKPNNSGAFSYWKLEPGGGQPRKDAFRMPFNSYDGKQNIVCYGKTSGAEQRLVTPTMDLTSVVNGDPRLIFYYASPKESNGFCRLRLQYRVGSGGQWKAIPGAPELLNVENWTQVSVRLPKDLRKKDVQLGFYSIQNNGYGTSIDEVYVVNMEAARAEVRAFDLYPQSPLVARGAKKVPLMRIEVAVGPGGGKLKLEDLCNQGHATKLYATDKNGRKLVTALTNIALYVGQGSVFSSAKYAADIVTVPDAGEASYKVSALTVKDHSALCMDGGNVYSVWIVADVVDQESVPFKSKIWVNVDEQSCRFVAYGANEPDATLGGNDKHFFPTEGNSYATPVEQRSIVYKSLFSDDFEAGMGKWKLPTGVPSQLWAVGNPSPNAAAYTAAGKTRNEAQVNSAYSGTKVLATGELLNGGDVLRARQFSRMILADEAGKPGVWIEMNQGQLLDASTLKDVNLMFQKSFNTPYGMVFCVDGQYEGETTWVEFSHYDLTSSDWQGWQPLSLRLDKADGRKFKLRLRAFYAGNYESYTGFILDDIQLLGDEVQDDVGVSGLSVSESWNNGQDRGIKFTVHNYGKNPQSNVTYDVYIDGQKALGGQSLGATLQSGGSKEVEIKPTGGFAQLYADAKKDNTHHVEVRLTLSGDEDQGNNVAQVSTYSFPTIEVNDEKFYPEQFGEPMRHWYGEPYKEGYKSTWLFNSVYNISKCRDNQGKIAGRFGSGLLLGSYIWTTGDQQALGYEQSVLLSPIFSISTADATVKKPKEIVFAYATEGDQVEVYVEYHTETDKAWKRLEKSTDWERGWYDGGAVWKGTTDGYKIVKTQLPEALQGKGGQPVKAQFRMYFFNRTPERAGGVAVNGVELRPMRADLSVVSVTPEGGCAKPLGNEETLKITIKNSEKPEVAQEELLLPVSIEVKRGNDTYREVKLIQLPKLEKGVQKEFDTEVQMPWGAVQGVNSTVRVILLPQNSEKGLADEDVSNNEYEKEITAKVPGQLPLREIVVENGKYVLYSSIGRNLQLLNGPGDGYEGYRFENFSITSGTAATVTGNAFRVNKYDEEVTLRYKVKESECEVNLPIMIKEAKCDVYVEKIALPADQPDVDCKSEKDELRFVVTIRDHFTPSNPRNLRLVVTQGGRELYNEPAELGEGREVKVRGVRSGGGVLKFTAVADADADGSNNTKPYDREILLYPDPLTVFLQDINETSYMRKVEPDIVKGENTYGTRQWQLYVPSVSGVDSIHWKRNNVELPADKKGYLYKLGATSGVLEAYVSLKEGNEERCARKKVFEVKINNEDVEVRGLGGATGLSTLCADERGDYNLYVELANLSWVTYARERWMAFRLSKADGSDAEDIAVELTDDWYPGDSRVLSLGKLPSKLRPVQGASAASFKVEYLGVYEDLEKTKVAQDANVQNNVKISELKLSTAPKLQWSGITAVAGGEYVVKKVFPVGSTAASAKLTVDDGGEAGMSYAWYSKSSGSDAWSPILSGGQLKKEYQIYGVAEDCYKVEVTNLSGCMSEISMRYIQTDVRFDDIKPLLSPDSLCSIHDNDGSVMVRLKNSGSKPLTRREKFKIKFSLNRVAYESAEMTFNGLYNPNEPIEILVKNVDLSEAIRDAKGGRLNINNLELVVIDDWAVTTIGKRIASVRLTEKGNPDPRVYLFKELQAVDFVGINRDKLVGPEEGVSKSAEVSIDNTFGTLLAYVKKGKGETAKWRWRYQSGKVEDVPLTATREDSLVEIPTNVQKQWMRDHIQDVGALEGTLNEPRQPNGIYTVEVTDKNLCRSRVRFSVEEKAYDIALFSLTVPRSACDLNPEKMGYSKVVVAFRNVGSMPIGKDEEIKLTLNREDIKTEALKEEWEKTVYAEYLASEAGKATLEKVYKVGDLYGGKDLESGGVMQVEVPVTLYREGADDGGVVRSALDGMKFKFTARVDFVDAVKCNETNKTNNESNQTAEIQDYPTPRVTKFTVKGKAAQVALRKGKGDYYIRKNDDPNTLVVGASVTPSTNVTSKWWFRGSLKGNGMASLEDPDMSGVSVTGTGELYVQLKLEGEKGCEGDGSIYIMENEPDLVVAEKVEGLPKELCPEDVSGAKKVKVWLKNASPAPLIVDETKCGKSGVQPSKVTVTLKDQLTGGTKVVEKSAEELFGKSDLYSYVWKERQSGSGEWEKSSAPTVSNGVGLSGFGEVSIEIDGFQFGSEKWVANAVGAIEVSFVGGCEKNTNNNSRQFDVKVRPVPNMDGVLTSAKTFYVKRGTTAHWKEEWTTDQKLQKSMTWGLRGEQGMPVQAEDVSSDKLGLSLSASASGTYVLKVRDEMGCVGSKEQEVSLPGFLSLVDDAIKVEPSDLVTGSCDYKQSEQKLKVSVVNDGNTVLDLAGKRIQLKFDMKRDGVVVGTLPLEYTFSASESSLEVGGTKEIEVEMFKNYDLSEAGIYQLAFSLETGKTPPVDEAPANMRGGERNVEIRRYYNPSESISWTQQLAEYFDAGSNYRALEKTKVGDPKTFKLYGLGDYHQNVSSASYQSLKKAGTMWTWYVDGKEVEGPSPDVYMKEFTKPAPDGWLKVKLATVNGCEQVSDSIELRWLKEYGFSSIALSPMSSQMCSDLQSGSADDLKDVKGSFMLAKADGVLPKGETITLRFSHMKEGSGTWETTNYPIVLDKDYVEGERIPFIFKVRFEPGKHGVQMSGGEYHDTRSGRYWQIGASQGVPVEFEVKANPYFIAALEREQKAYGKPYLIKLPDAAPGKSGDWVRYNWENEGAKEDKNYEVRVSKDYQVVVMEENGCSLKEGIHVDFYYKYDVVVDQGEGRIEVIDAQNGVSYSAGEQAIKDGAKVKFNVLPGSQYEILGVLVGDDPSVDWTKEYPVTSDFKLLVSFRKKQNENPGTNPTAVESEMLRGVQTVNPFTNALKLYGTGNVLEYAVYNQLGREVFRGRNDSGNETLEVEASSLPEGVYVVRLRDVNGGERALRVVKVKKVM